MRVSMVTLGLLALIIGGARTGIAQKERILARGQLHYQRYCEVCHGETGKGDGPMGEYLKVTPADLSRLRKKNGGTFPFWQVYRIVDGRQAVTGHGTREMPIWGNEMRVAEQDLPAQLEEDVVAGQIWQLLLYVQSLQE